MSNICIIPARGGSKRILKKNLKDFLGKPILLYSIELAKKADVFDKIFVSTDDIEIAEFCKSNGVEIDFLRSEENSSDFSTTVSVINEVLEYFNNKYDFCLCLYPTSPLANKFDLLKGYELIKQGYKTIVAITEFESNPQRAFKILNNEIKMINPEMQNKRSQDLEKLYFDSGQWYWINTRTYDKKQLFTDNSSFITINKLFCQDINDEVDWKLAEIKYKLIYENNYNS